MRDAWLVQRCTLSGEAFTDQIMTGKYFDLDYMGSAEFEFGAIPKFQRAIHAKLHKMEVVEVKMENGKRLFALVDSEHAEAYKDMLKRMVQRKFQTKEPTYLNYVVGNDKWGFSYSKPPCFWMDITNNCVFSTDLVLLTHFTSTVKNSVIFMDSQK